MLTMLIGRQVGICWDEDSKRLPLSAVNILQSRKVQILRILGEITTWLLELLALVFSLSSSY